MDKKKSIEALQFFVTHLAEGAIVSPVRCKWAPAQ